MLYWQREGRGSHKPAPSIGAFAAFWCTWIGGGNLRIAAGCGVRVTAFARNAGNLGMVCEWMRRNRRALCLLLLISYLVVSEPYSGSDVSGMP